MPTPQSTSEGFKTILHAPFWSPEIDEVSPDVTRELECEISPGLEVSIVKILYTSKNETFPINDPQSLVKLLNSKFELINQWLLPRYRYNDIPDFEAIEDIQKSEFGLKNSSNK